MQEDKDNISHICQNCGFDLSGNYCSNCGQEGKAVLNRSVISLLHHFFEELFVWDSRFFRSVKYLFIRPGFLTHEYISGRINRYISPLKMFLFTSFVLFFIMIKSDPDQYSGLVTGAGKDDLLEEYILDQKNRSSYSEEVYINNFNDQFNDNITLYIFIIMFLFSLLLKIIYITKKYYYSEHIVFTLHFFTFVLCCFLGGVITQDLSDYSIYIFMFFIPGIYLFIAVKRVYHESLLPSLFASSFMTFSYWILVTIWMLGTVFLSAYRAA